MMDDHSFDTFPGASGEGNDRLDSPDPVSEKRPWKEPVILSEWPAPSVLPYIVKARDSGKICKIIAVTATGSGNRAEFQVYDETAQQFSDQVRISFTPALFRELFDHEQVSVAQSEQKAKALQVMVEPSSTSRIVIDLDRESRRREKMREFRHMRAGEEVLIGSYIYCKIDDRRFSVKRRDYDDFYQNKTQVRLSNNYKQITEIEILLNDPYLDPDEIEFGQNLGSLPVIAEDPAYLRQIELQFNTMREELFPHLTSDEDIAESIRKSYIRQGGKGNCYMLAGANSLKKKHARLYLETLKRSMYKAGQAWSITFRGDEGNIGTVIISESEVEDWKSKGSSASLLSDIIFERAYASFVSRRENNNRQGMTIVIPRGHKMAFEGGFGHRSLFDFLGPEVARKHIVGDYEMPEQNGYTDRWYPLVHQRTPHINFYSNSQMASHFLLNEFPRSDDAYIVTANTPSREGGLRLTDRHFKEFTVDGTHVKDMEPVSRRGFFSTPRKIRIPYRHALSVIESDSDYIWIEDPHDTTKPFALHIDTFLNTFSQLSYVRLIRRYSS